MTIFLLATLLTVIQPATTEISTEVPLRGAAISEEALEALNRLPGVTASNIDGKSISVDVADNAELRVSDINQVLAVHSPDTRVDRDRLIISPHTIFQLNAGVCFFCAEQPLGQTLDRRPFVKTWSVVDYWQLGRLLFRIEPNRVVRIEELGRTNAFEDIVLTNQFDDRGAPDLYWSTGGVEWRKDEQAARHEATASKKPLMIFPTAGT